MLLKTRELILQSAGFEVTSVLGLSDALANCAPGEYSLAILGHSIPPPDRRVFIREIRRVCTAPLLALVVAGETPLDGADYRLDISDGPAALLEMVKEITNSRQQSDAAGLR